MEVFILHILKLNIIAAVVILLVKVLATLFKGRVSARWKYFIWLLITISLCVPVRLPENLALVDFKVLRSSQQNTQNPKITDYAVRPEKSQKITETVSSASNDMKNLTEIPEQKRTVRYESDKWLGIVALIFAAVWLSVTVLKLTGELLAYYFSIRNLERMSLQVSDTVSIQMYRAACQKKHVRRIPELRQNAGLTTPLLAGLLHTKLYLPATGYSAEERKLIFYHELTHYCHRDLWYKMLLRICASIYWFNPFLLIMLKEADKDIENLCDTAVVRRVNKKEHKLYRQLLLRTVAMENQIPYVTASLNDSEMVFKDRILYMVNIRKLRKGILPGILVTLLLAGGNLVFNVSAGTDTVSVETEKSGIEKNADPEKNNVPDYAPFSEMVTMQKAAETQDEGGVTENTDTEDSVDEEEKADAETNDEPAMENSGQVSETTDEPAMENSGQVSETTDDGITSDNNGSVSSYENLPAGVPYTSGFTTTSGVASIVAPGGGDEESRVLYDNGDGTYSDYYGSRYSYQGDGNWADANGNSYRTWNDEGYHFGNQLEQHELQGSNGTVNVIETTNGDYYYCDADGVGYTDNGDGTWTDENGNIYTE
ncbi:signal transduction protein [Blautia obeum]|uniref:Signal transduction protein n=3 Tax=Blautia TaxID=572511 RepID=A0A3E5E4G8_9FIRM|nr:MULTISPECIES: M56 family metallopeptidase [Clostridia]RGN83851.1 signal transduction protein [Blautia obeum]RHK22513.1 signal transduction protein [Ruminococcus sp. AF46-10NS]